MFENINDMRYYIIHPLLFFSSISMIIYQWDGKIEPRLLSTSSSNLSSTTSNGVPDASITSSSCKATLMAKSNITNYAFLNEEAKVKIYVNLPGVGVCVDENITLDYTEQSLCLTIKNYMSPSAKVKEEVDELLVVDTAPPAAEEEGEETKKGEDRCLAFGKLYGSIEKAMFKKKVDKVIITLKKKDDKVWNAVCA